MNLPKVKEAVNTFQFKAINHAYGEASKFFATLGIPTLEQVLDEYDTIIRFQFDEYFPNHPNVNSIMKTGIPDRDRLLFEERTGLKFYLSSTDLKMIFHAFPTVYHSELDKFHNLPIEDVW